MKRSLFIEVNVFVWTNSKIKKEGISVSCFFFYYHHLHLEINKHHDKILISSVIRIEFVDSATSLLFFIL